MSWSFNGGAETYAVFGDVGDLPQNGAPISVWAMVRLSGDAGGLFLGREAGSSRIGMLVFASTLFLNVGSAFGGAVPTGEWIVLGYDDNNAGGGTPRLHMCTGLATTPTWSHADGSSSGDRSGLVDELRIGDYEGVHMGGHIAAECVAAGRLGDAGFEALGVTSMATWVAAADLAWQMNVAVGATALLDLTGGGADQTSLVGTPTLDTGQEPPNWTYHTANEATLEATAPAATAATSGRIVIRAAADATGPAATATLAARERIAATAIGTGPAAVATMVGRERIVATLAGTAPAATAVLNQAGGGTVVPKPSTGTVSRSDTGLIEVPRIPYP